MKAAGARPPIQMPRSNLTSIVTSRWVRFLSKKKFNYWEQTYNLGRQKLLKIIYREDNPMRFDMEMKLVSWGKGVEQR